MNACGAFASQCARRFREGPAHAATALLPQHRRDGAPERAHFDKWLMWLTNTLQVTLIIHFYPKRWASTPGAVV
ncbi:hypothetical protein [Caldimonas caldifontis]|uniref:hypothetical protein n=1 Tax=Caldimonas caldifontis TaxID=1452508 RepID=UPI003AF3D207